MITPELCQLLLDQHPDAGGPGDQYNYTVADVGTEPLWRLGVIMFELLHGYSPWDSPDPDARGLANDSHTLDLAEMQEWRAHRDDRRRRMINEPLPLAELIPRTQTHMTQDCADVLRAMLANDPTDRPSVEELASFPWFQGSYLDSGTDFTRPAKDDSEFEIDGDGDDDSG